MKGCLIVVIILLLPFILISLFGSAAIFAFFGELFGDGMFWLTIFIIGIVLLLFCAAA